MRKILKLLTFILAAIGVCTAALVCFILIYPVFYGDFSSKEARVPKALSDTQEENLLPAETTSSPSAASPAVSPASVSTAAPLNPSAIPAEENETQPPAPTPTPTQVPAPTPTAQVEEIPIEYQSALNRADNYCDLMHMSKEAIYDQLTSEYGENVSPEAARYAVNHVRANWNENALQKAKIYSETMFMSRTAIYNQLISDSGEKFTEAQAQYAMEHLEADWNANALHKAKEYRESTNMTKSAIYDQLISEHGDKFEPEEASYAIKNLK